MGAYGSPELYPHNTQCKKCGKELSANANFCEHCGYAVNGAVSPVKAYCLHCKTQFTDNSKYCAKCGQPRLITVTMKKSKLILRYLLSLLALFLCLIGVFSFPDFVAVGVCFLACGVLILCLLFKQAKNDRALIQKVQDANFEIIKQHALDRFKDDNPNINKGE